MYCTTHTTYDYTCDDCHGYTLEPGDTDRLGNKYGQHEEYMATYDNDSVTVPLYATGWGLVPELNTPRSTGTQEIKL